MTVQRPRITRRQMLAASSAALVSGPFLHPTPSFAWQTPAAPPAAGGPQLHVAPARVWFDEAFQVAVTGLGADDEVTIRSSFLDARGQPWVAEATFAAGAWGFLDCSAQAPVSGSFDAADSMAFIWAAQGGEEYAPTVAGVEPVEIAATVSGTAIGSVTVERTILPAGGSSTTIDQPGLAAEFYEPSGEAATSTPGIIVLGGSDGGVSPTAHATAGLLAAHGYAALAVAYFGIGSLPPTLERIPLEYFATAIGWLQDQPAVDPGRLGVLGRSRGGELALLLASHYPEFSASVSYAGSGYVMPAPLVLPPAPAWTWQGNDLPFATTAFGEEVEIPVERIDGPVLLVSGDADGVWPSTALSTGAWDRLQRTEHPWPNQFLRFPGAGHAIEPPYAPADASALPIGSYSAGGDARSNAVASVGAWRAVLNMLDWRLKSRA